MVFCRAVGVIQATFKHNEVCIRPRWDGHNAETGATDAIRARPVHFVHLVFGRIDRTRKAVAVAVALDLDPPCGHLVAERRGRFEIDGVPGQLDKSVAGAVGVGSGHIRAPIANRRGR